MKLDLSNPGPWLSDVAVKLGIGLAVLFACVIVGRMLGAWLRKLMLRRSARAGTLGAVVRDACGVLGLAVGVIMALSQLGLNVGALLASAGVLGLAVGFGAQSLVKDVISGFFIILDGSIAEGDIVEVDCRTGVVESVGLRTTQIRALDGQLWYIQNGEIRAVGNHSREWARVLMEVGLAYEADVAEGMRVLQSVGERYAEEHPEVVLEPPEVQGALSLADSSVGVRLVVKVVASEKWGADRELRLRCKAAFDESGIEIPFPRRVVYHRMDPDGKELRVVAEGEQSRAAE